MEGYPKDGTREEMLAWLREKAPTGLLGLEWRDSHPEIEARLRNKPDLFLDTLSEEKLRRVIYVPELGKYTTPELLLIYIPYQDLTKSVHYSVEKSGVTNNYGMPVYNHFEVPLKNETFLSLFGSLPPLHGDVRPTPISSLEEFDMRFLTPVPPDTEPPEPPMGVKPYKSSFSEDKIQEFTAALKAKVAAFQAEVAAKQKIFLETSDPLERIKTLTDLLTLKFKAFPILGLQILPKTKRRPEKLYQIANDGHYHSFLVESVFGNLPITGWKERKRLTTDSKQLQFARAVGGLILYLLKQIPKETLLDPKNIELFGSLFTTYTYELGATTFDMLAIGDHLKLLAEELNAYVGYDWLVFDCENEGKSERCYRGVLAIENSEGKYRIIFTDVSNMAIITDDNQMRILAKYSGGGRRRTRKHKTARKRSRQSRRWGKPRRH